MKPIVAIVGRPNVGKSTLFNRLSDHKKAIVIDQPGATRDRNYTDCEWNGRSFTIIDTGGFEPVSNEKMLVQMREQTNLAIEEADVIIFLMDGPEGLTPSDEEISHILRRTQKPVIYAVNKIDGKRQEELSYEFYRLGIENIFAVSSQHGLGIGDLMDAVVERLPESSGPFEDDERIRIAVIGRPNAGKSSLVNKILGYDRTIVNAVPGTTRDAIDTPFQFGGKRFLLIDTAGIRKKKRISMTLEKYSVMEAIKTLGRCDVALIMIDSQDGVTEQDTKIAGLAYERGIPSILVLNKWDLIEKDNSTIGNYVHHVQDKLKYFDFAPILTISALTGQRINKLFDIIETLQRQAGTRISTAHLNEKLRHFIDRVPPPRVRNRPNNISYATQASVNPPTFVFFVRDTKGIHFSYERYLENRIREEFDFDNVPIRLLFRKKGRDRKMARK